MTEINTAAETKPAQSINTVTLSPLPSSSVAAIASEMDLSGDSARSALPVGPRSGMPRVAVLLSK
jgi:hypothetical protein